MERPLQSQGRSFHIFYNSGFSGLVTLGKFRLANWPWYFFAALSRQRRINSGFGGFYFIFEGAEVDSFSVDSDSGTPAFHIVCEVHAFVF